MTTATAAWLLCGSIATAPQADRDAAKVAVLPVKIEGTATIDVPIGIVDDVLLTAVQNATGARVIGAQDLDSVLGFENQKALAGCDDVTCIVEIAGALHATRLVVVRIAWLGSEWTVTAKVIGVGGEPEVEARTTDFVSGDVGALVRALPGIAQRLFAIADADSATQSPAATQPAKPEPPATTATRIEALTPPSAAPAPAWPAWRTIRYASGIGAIGIATTSAILFGVGQSRSDSYTRLTVSSGTLTITASDLIRANNDAAAFNTAFIVTAVSALVLGSTWGISWLFD